MIRIDADRDDDNPVYNLDEIKFTRDSIVIDGFKLHGTTTRPGTRIVELVEDGPYEVTITFIAEAVTIDEETAFHLRDEAGMEFSRAFTPKSLGDTSEASPDN